MLEWIKTAADIEKAAKHIIALSARAVLIKGGRRKEARYAEDLFMGAGRQPGARIQRH
nr:bifunctional hydroxymethylpyrimidine kinase/phosphomethylpyrimidine kinase [Sporosarcina sp. ANT_H38]